MNLDTLLRNHENDVDDTDDLDPEGEYQLWKEREFYRLRRDHGLLEEEKQEPQQQENDETEQAQESNQRTFLQKYYHKGAFYQDLEGVDKMLKRVFDPLILGCFRSYRR